MSNDLPDSQDFWRNRQTMVTGGNGFLGKFIVGKLHEREAAVFVAGIDRYDPLCAPPARAGGPGNQ